MTRRLLAFQNLVMTSPVHQAFLVSVGIYVHTLTVQRNLNDAGFNGNTLKNPLLTKKHKQIRFSYTQTHNNKLAKGFTVA